jgi:ketosteroid isomerase-like protein
MHPHHRTRDEAELARIFAETLPGMVRTRDIHGYVSLFTEDAAWCPPSAPDRFGHAEITVGITQTLANQNIEPYFYIDQLAVLEPDFGYILGRSKEILQPHDGSPTTIAYSRELWQFRRVHHAWKISHLIFNLKPPPAGGDGNQACR